MSRSVAFDSLDEALAAYQLGPVKFVCAVCGRRHSIQEDGQLPSTAGSCVRALDTLMSSAYAYASAPNTFLSPHGRYVVPPAWSLLHCGLPNLLDYTFYCGAHRVRRNVVPFAVMLMLRQPVFIQETVAHRRAVRLADGITEDQLKETQEMAKSFGFDYGGTSIYYVGPPKLPLPVKLDFRNRGAAIDANGAEIRLPHGITFSRLRTQIQQMYWPAYAFTDKDMSLTRDKLVGAVLERDRMIVVLSGANKKRTKHCTVAYPVIGYELMMPWRLWDHEVDMHENLIDRVAEALQA